MSVTATPTRGSYCSVDASAHFSNQNTTPPTATTPCETSSATSTALKERSNMLAHLVDPNSSDEAQMAAARYFRKVLSRPNSTRNCISDLLEHQTLVPALLKGLTRPRLPELQLDCCWAITNLACGDCVQTHKLVDNGAIPVLIQVANSTGAGELRDQAVWALSNISGDCASCKSKVINHGFLRFAVRIVIELSAAYLDALDETSGQSEEAVATDPTHMQSLHTAVWSLSNATRGRNHHADYAQLTPVLPTLCRLVTHRDTLPTDLVADTLWALAYMANGTVTQIQAVLDTGITVELIDCMSSTNERVMTGALRAIGNLITGSDAQTQYVIQRGVLPALDQLASHANRDVRREVAWTLSNITAGTPDQIEQVMRDSGLMSKLIDMLFQDQSKVRKEVAWTLVNALSGGSQNQRVCMCDWGALHWLPHMMRVDVWRRDERLMLAVLAALRAFFEALRDTNMHDLKGMLKHNSFHEALTALSDANEDISDAVRDEAREIYDEFCASAPSASPVANNAEPKRKVIVINIELTDRQVKNLTALK